MEQTRDGSLRKNLHLGVRARGAYIAHVQTRKGFDGFGGIGAFLHYAQRSHLVANFLFVRFVHLCKLGRKFGGFFGIALGFLGDKLD